MKKIDDFFKNLTKEEQMYLFKKSKEYNKNATRKRDKQVKFFVSEDELKKIDEKVKKSGFTKSDYLRAAALDKNILVIEELKEFYIELKKQGNNLNQLAKAVHNNRINDTGNLDEILAEYKKITNFLSEIVRKI